MGHMTENGGETHVHETHETLSLRTEIDPCRVEDGKIAERWGFPEELPPQEDLKNNNGVL
jgi:hypothetical protein